MDHSQHGTAAEGRARTRLAITATLHCLTGCAIGEVLGMIIGTALGWTDLQTVALAVGLAFLFGYAFTIGPVMRSGLALRAAVPVALAADTISITVMEVVDNAIMLGVPGAMDAGLISPLFWGALAFALLVAFVVTVPVNRWLIARGKGHAVVHQYHQRVSRDGGQDAHAGHSTARTGGHGQKASGRPRTAPPRTELIDRSTRRAPRALPRRRRQVGTSPDTPP